LARALCAGPRLLVLDEPVTGLDPIVTMEFYHLIRELNKTRGISIIMVTHEIKEAVSQADHILHLHNKQLYFGSVAGYLATPLGKFFSGGGRDGCKLY
jgi:zinc transport system ATP-binding protein